MKRPQSAITKEGSPFAIYMTFALEPGGGPGLRRALAGLAALTAETARELDEPGLVSAAGIGALAWPEIFGTEKPPALDPFEALADGPRRAPSTEADLFLHIHSPRHDVNFHLARRVRASFGAAARLVEEVHGFRNHQCRDLTGFVDGTENPQGEDRAQVALVGPEDPEFEGGSFVAVQRYVHDLARWESLDRHSQEKVIGRSKEDDVELDDRHKPPFAHIARVVIEEDGRELEILRHSLPYGTTGEHGLYFVAYCRSPLPFRRMLANMVRRDGEGHYDRLLDFTRAVTGAAFFVPSLDFLESAG